jgi:hypothetical protein
MKDQEKIASYLLCVDEIVNIIKGLGEIAVGPMIVKKVLRSLPLIFDVKVSSIKEMKDVDQLTMYELHGILTACEMRTESKNHKRKKHISKPQRI